VGLALIVRNASGRMSAQAQYLASCALFGAILLALVIAALVLNPFAVSVP